jgi:hypothetical protein
MHQAACSDDIPAKVMAHGLVAQAHAEYRLPAGKGLDDVERDAGLMRRAWPGRQEDPVRVQGEGFLCRDLVIPEYPLLHAHLTEVLDEVVGKGIEVIDDEEHRLIIDP